MGPKTENSKKVKSKKKSKENSVRFQKIVYLSGN